MNLINYTPRKTYMQLNHEARIKISALLDAGLSQSEIARQLGVHRSTISREIKRGSVTTQNYDLTYSTNYEAKTAQNFCNQWNLNSRKKPKYLGYEKVLKEIENLVKKDKYSFEIIAGRMKYLSSKDSSSSFTFSFKTLYNYRKKKILHIPDRYMPSHTYSKSSKATRRANKAGKSIELRPEKAVAKSMSGFNKAQENLTHTAKVMENSGKAFKAMKTSHNLTQYTINSLNHTTANTAVGVADALRNILEKTLNLGASFAEFGLSSGLQELILGWI